MYIQNKKRKEMFRNHERTQEPSWSRQQHRGITPASYTPLFGRSLGIPTNRTILLLPPTAFNHNDAYSKKPQHPPYITITTSTPPLHAVMRVARGDAHNNRIFLRTHCSQNHVTASNELPLGPYATLCHPSFIDATPQCIVTAHSKTRI